MTEQGASDNLHRLVRHWEIESTKDKYTPDQMQIFQGCAKQLRQRLKWLDEDKDAAAEDDARQ